MIEAFLALYLAPLDEVIRFINLASASRVAVDDPGTVDETVSTLDFDSEQSDELGSSVRKTRWKGGKLIREKLFSK